MTTDEIISRCYEHGQPDYVLVADRLKELQAECNAARDSAADARMLAFKWMKRHDRIAAGKDGGSYPAPADIPEAIAALTDARNEADNLRDALHEATTRAIRAEQQRDEAVRVLQPLSDAADKFDDAVYGDLLKLGTENLTLGHLRAARDLVRRLASGPEGGEKP